MCIQCQPKTQTSYPTAELKDRPAIKRVCFAFFYFRLEGKIYIFFRSRVAEIVTKENKKKILISEHFRHGRSRFRVIFWDGGNFIFY